MSLGTQSKEACSRLTPGERVLLLILVLRALEIGEVGREALAGGGAKKALLVATGTVQLVVVLAGGSGS